MDVLGEGIRDILTSIFLLVQAHNPILMLCGIAFCIGLLFFVLSFLQALWNVHITIRLGPITLIFLAIMIAWLEMSDGAREALAEWIRKPPKEWYGESFTEE